MRWTWPERTPHTATFARIGGFGGWLRPTRPHNYGPTRARAFCPLAAALAALAALAWASLTPASAAAQPETDSERALASYTAMQQQFYMPWHHLYRGEETESAQEFAFFWPTTQALAAKCGECRARASLAARIARSAVPVSHLRALAAHALHVR